MSKTLKRVNKSLTAFSLPQMVFSSSCTVYGNPTETPINETHPLSAVSPYGRSKLIIEEIFRDYSAADPSWRTILLRYFNPVGAHPSGGYPAWQEETCHKACSDRALPNGPFHTIDDCFSMQAMQGIWDVHSACTAQLMSRAGMQRFMSTVGVSQAID